MVNPLSEDLKLRDEARSTASTIVTATVAVMDCAGVECQDKSRTKKKVKKSAKILK